MIVRRPFSLLAAFAFWSAASLAGAGNGFQIVLPTQPLPAEVMASLATQLALVESARLPPHVLDAMKRTPILIDPELDDKHGVFVVRRGVGIIRLSPMVFSAKRPILLHELLHAYHFNVLGRNRSEIGQEYRRLKNSNLFPPRFQDAHFLKNEKEFFAVTATLHLFGDLQQPPFTCTALSKLDAGYLAFLDAQFGPHRCPALAQRGERKE